MKSTDSVEEVSECWEQSLIMNEDQMLFASRASVYYFDEILRPHVDSESTRRHFNARNSIRLYLFSDNSGHKRTAVDVSSSQAN